MADGTSRELARRLLIVEDSATQAEALRTLLEENNFMVSVAVNGREALKTAAEWRPDMILSDIVMPEVDGYDLCREVKSRPPLAAIPVILLTSLSDPQDVLKGLACGADSFVTKPYDASALLARIEGIWQSYATARSQDDKVTLELFFEGRKHKVTANLVQSVNLLMATSAVAVQRYNDLARAEEELIKTNASLETRVRARTAELSREVGEHLATERALRESEEKHRSMIASLSEGIVLQAATGEILASNASAEAILGIASADGLVSPQWECIHEDGFPFPLDEQPAMRALATGKPQSAVLMGLRKPGGEVSWVSMNSRPMTRPGEQAPYAVVSSFTDMTAARLTGERLRQQLYWTNVLNSLSTAVAQRTNVDSILRVAMRHLEESFPFELAGVVLQASDGGASRLAVLSKRNESLARRLGMAEGLSLDPDMGLIAPGAPSLEATVMSLEAVRALRLGAGSQELIGRLLQAGIGSMAVIPLALPDRVFGAILLLSQGTLELTEYQRSFLHGMVETIALAMQNWSLYEDLDRAYAELKRTQQQAIEQVRLRAMGQMASGIAHDINNTLAPITLYTEALLASEEHISERGRRFLGTIQQATRDIEGVVARLRVFYGRRGEGEQLQPIAVTDLFRHVIELTRPRWEAIPQRQGVTIEVRTEVAEGLPLLVGNEGEVREALVNLLFNAVDAMARGGSILLRGSIRGPRMALEVVDTGVGMDEEQKRRCLEPFYTTKGDRGTGLGLSMVYGVVQRHGGELEIESSPGCGTSARLLFPLREMTVAQAAEESMTAAPGPLRILCIDDDPSVLQSLQDAIELDGHRVQTADGGEAGLAAFRRTAAGGARFDLVITDLGMPHMDGHQVARELKAADPSVPVILLSGWGSLMHLDGERPPVVDAVLGKPPRIAELRAAIRSLAAGAKRT